MENNNIKAQHTTDIESIENSEERRCYQNSMKHNDSLRKYASKTGQIPFIYDASMEHHLGATVTDNSDDPEEDIAEFIKMLNRQSEWKEPLWIHDITSDTKSVSGKKYLMSCTCSKCGYHANMEKPVCPQCRSKMK